MKILPERVSDRWFFIFGMLVLALAACIHLFFFARGFYSIGWDESGRTLDAYEWAVHGTVKMPAWLPFYRIIVGMGLRVFPDLFLTPRITNFFFGMAAIPATAWLAHELFQSRKTAMLTLLLSALQPQRVALSLSPLDSIMFDFLILVTMASFARWLRTGSTSAMLVCALIGALGSTDRYEGWVFNAAILVVAVTGYCFKQLVVPRRYLFLFGFILLCFPSLSAFSTFSAATAIDAVAEGAAQYSQMEIFWRDPGVEFLITSAASLNLIGVIAVVQSARDGVWSRKAIIAASFSPLIVLSVGLLLVRSVQTTPSWRMVGVWTLLLTPFTARLLSGDSWSFSGRRFGKVLAVSATVLVLVAFVHNMFQIERDSAWAFPRSDRMAGKYLDDLIATYPGTRILIESSEYFFLNIQVASQHPDAFELNSLPRKQSVPILPLGSSVRAALAKEGLTVLVFRGDDYKTFLNQSRDVTKVADFGPWSIYELTK